MSNSDELEPLIVGTASGDRAAFEDLYARTSAKLFGITLRILTDPAEAGDALRDLFIKIRHDAGTYQVSGLEPMTWLVTVARNHAVDRLRQRRATVGSMAEAMAASGQGGIDDCLDQLEPDHADAVRRAYLEGETYDELAQRYTVPLDTIRTWLRRGLLKLGECLSS